MTTPGGEGTADVAGHAFGPGFLWGTATAPHQVEGGNVNSDLWAMEWAEGSMFAEPSGDACDHYHRYREDMAVQAELGFNASRFGVEWARIEPEEGYFSRAALDHYRRVCAACLEEGLTPVVTYNHFSVPRWFASDLGWEHPKAAARFGRYAEAVTAHLGDLVGWVCTINEPNVVPMIVDMARSTDSAAAGAPARTHRSMEAAARKAGAEPDRFRPWTHPPADPLGAMAAAHAACRDAVRSGRGDARVGWTLALPDFQPVEDGGERAAEARRTHAERWLEVSRDDDFVGVQTYTRELIGPSGRMPPPDGASTTQMGWEVYPEALEHTVRLSAAVSGVPVLVTENGIATDDDDARIDYTRRALQGLARCQRDGVDVRGYVHWTLLDNFEWLRGYAPTFGLIAVDRGTFERTVKPSARWLGAVARHNALSHDH